jgi:hypothetical protein
MFIDSFVLVTLVLITIPVFVLAFCLQLLVGVKLMLEGQQLSVHEEPELIDRGTGHPPACHFVELPTEPLVVTA